MGRHDPSLRNNLHKIKNFNIASSHQILLQKKFCPNKPLTVQHLFFYDIAVIDTERFLMESEKELV